MKTFFVLFAVLLVVAVRAANVTTRDGGDLLKDCGGKKNNCTCTFFDDDEMLLKLECNHKGFFSMLPASMLPAKVAEIDLNLNKIVNLQQLEPNDELKRLSLGTNNLRKLDNYAFEHTKNLFFIDLSFNELRELPETIFDSLADLQFLNLSHNLLRSIPKNLFRQTRMLSELNLSNNPIKYIVGEQFLNLDKLYSLNLAHNEIFSLASDIFHGLTALTDLDLSRNDFEAVPNNALRLVHRLHRLDLSHNPIRVINQASFRGMRTLRHLAINQMKHLYAIERNAFSELTALEQLFIEDNSVLAYIDEYAFAGMFNSTWLALKYFSFRKNHLSHLHEKTLPFCRIADFDLAENPWDCNCHLRWLKDCHGADANQNSLICVKPANLRGHSLQQLTKENMLCHTSEGSASLYMLYFFAFGFFVTAILLILHRKRIANFFTTNKNNGPIYYVRASGGEF